MPHEKAKPAPGLGSRIHEVLEELGMSQNQLQQAANIGQGDVTRLITGQKGKRLSAETLLAVARALDVNPHWLWDNTGPKRLSTGTPKTNVDRAVALAREIKMTETAIAEGVSHFEGIANPPFLDVFDAIRHADRRELLRSSNEVAQRGNERARFKTAKKKRAPKSERAVSPPSERAKKKTGST